MRRHGLLDSDDRHAPTVATSIALLQRVKHLDKGCLRPYPITNRHPYIL